MRLYNLRIISGWSYAPQENKVEFGRIINPLKWRIWRGGAEGGDKNSQDSTMTDDNKTPPPELH